MNEKDYGPPLSAHDYFEQRILPSTMRSVEYTVSGPGSFEQHDNDTELLFVRGGRGTITVNAGVYEIQRGDLFCICQHHFHRISADPEHPLELTELHMNGGMFLYVASCPYYHPSSINVPYGPIHVRFDEEKFQRLEQLTHRITREKEPDSQLSFFLAVRIFGLMERYAPTKEDTRAIF